MGLPGRWMKLPPLWMYPGRPKTKILNQTCTSEELWAAFGWEVKNHEPQKREHRDVWKIVKQHLEDAGYVHGRVQGNGNRYLWRAPNIFHDLA